MAAIFRAERHKYRTMTTITNLPDLHCLSKRNNGHDGAGTNAIRLHIIKLNRNLAQSIHDAISLLLSGQIRSDEGVTPSDNGSC